MRFARAVLAPTLALLALPAFAQDPPGRLLVELSPPAEAKIGQRIPARLILEWDGADVEPEGPRFPVWDSGWGAAEVLEAAEVEPFVDQAGRRVWRQSLVLTAFETGEIRLPPRTVAVPTAEGTIEVTSDEKRFEIGSVLPADTGEPIEARPPAPLVDLEPDRTVPVALAVAALLLLGAAAWAVARARRQSPALRTDLVPARPPLEELELALGGVDPAASAEAAHVAISTGLRRYLGRRLEMRALESTTSELRRGLLGSPVPEDVTLALVQLLRACDQVKFARQLLEPERTADRLEQALRLARHVEAVAVRDDADAAIGEDAA